RAANSALQAIGERANHNVARIMAKLIVALLQVVKIQEKNRQRTRVTPRARNFLEKPLLTRTPVVQIGQRIQHRELVHFFREQFDFRYRFHLIRELPADLVDLRLLINAINAENQHKPDKPAHCLRQIERIRALADAQQPWKRKGGDSDSQQQDNENRGGPHPPLFPVEALQAGPNFSRTRKPRVWGKALVSLRG